MKTLILSIGILFCLTSFSQEEEIALPHCTVSLEEIIPPCEKENCWNYKIISSCEKILEFELKVFDRWGDLMHESNDQKVIWDTKDVPAGVYVWQIIWTDTGDGPQRAKGQITITK